MILTWRYKLKPSRAQHARLLEILDLQRQLYNAALEERISAWRNGKIHIRYTDQTASLKIIRDADPAFSALPHSLSRWSLRRLDDAFKAFFRRVKAGQTPGFPRFRSASRWDSFGMADLDGLRIQGGRLLLKGMTGALRLHQHRPLPAGAKLKTATFSREGRHWYVAFAVEMELTAQSEDAPLSAIGLDVGIEALATTYDGERIPNMRIGRKHQAALRRASRALSRCKRGSRRRYKVRARLVAVQRDIRNARRTYLHQVSAGITDRWNLICVEDLQLRNMTRSASGTLAQPGTNVAAKRGLNRALLDAAPGRLIEMIRYKAACAGGTIITVDPRGTSQTCSACGATVKKALSQRRHHCACGAELHRDHNAAINILARGLDSHTAGMGRGGANVEQQLVRRLGNAETKAA